MYVYSIGQAVLLFVFSSITFHFITFMFYTSIARPASSLGPVSSSHACRKSNRLQARTNHHVGSPSSRAERGWRRVKCVKWLDKSPTNPRMEFFFFYCTEYSVSIFSCIYSVQSTTHRWSILSRVHNPHLAGAVAGGAPPPALPCLLSA
jgi:hypothetical protein